MAIGNMIAIAKQFGYKVQHYMTACLAIAIEEFLVVIITARHVVIKWKVEGVPVKKHGDAMGERLWEIWHRLLVSWVFELRIEFRQFGERGCESLCTSAGRLVKEGKRKAL